MEKLRLLVVVCLIAWPVSVPAAAEDVAAAVTSRDAGFWKAYNACDVEGMGDFVAEDVEFYHDKGGATLGRTALLAGIRSGLCARPEWRLRREAVEGTVRAYPLQKDGAVYGVVHSGEHLFFINEKGKPEFLDGRARFTHLWLLKDGTWRMSRILSFDHGPASR